MLMRWGGDLVPFPFFLPMRNVALVYSRDLVSPGKSVELILWLYSLDAISWSPVHTEKLDALRQASQTLQTITRMVGSLGGNDPSLTNGNVLLSMIPESFNEGFTIPTWAFITNGTQDYWTAQANYLLVEGMCHAVLLPQFSAGWDLTLNGTLFFGIALTYRRIDEDVPPTQFDPNDYNSPYTLRNSGAGVNVYIPKVWNPTQYFFFTRATFAYGGYWYTFYVWAEMGMLWAYPPVTDEWDTRLMANNEIIIPSDMSGGGVILDDGRPEPDRRYADYSFLPTPTSRGCTRYWGVGDLVEDYMWVRAPSIPVYIRPKYDKMAGLPEAKRKGNRLIPVLLGGKKILGSKGFAVKPGGVLWSIAQKVLTMDGLIMRSKT